MKESATNPKRVHAASDPEMRDEYDFSGGVRGKYYQQYTESTNIIVLDPDVAVGFKNAEAVNSALRALMRVALDSQGSAPRKPRRARKSPEKEAGTRAPRRPLSARAK
jgi:hypothetical protein